MSDFVSKTVVWGAFQREIVCNSTIARNCEMS
jgi:hypothetical protein